MYRRSKFIEILHEIRQEMAAEADYDVVLFSEMVRSGEASATSTTHSLKDESPPTDRQRRETELEKASR